MEAQHNGSVHGTPPPEHRATTAVELTREVESLRATCRRQERVIDTLNSAVATLRDRTAALKSQNAELHAANDRRSRRLGQTGSTRPADSVELHLALDRQAPAAARAAVTAALCERAPAAVLANAQLVVSELVTNSVLHSGASPRSELILRMQLSGTAVRLDIEDGGDGDAIVTRRPDFTGRGGGF